MNTNDQKTVLVTGGSKGIGLEFAKQYLERGHRVFAASRSVAASPELRQLHAEFTDQLMIAQVDVGDEESRRQLYSSLSTQIDRLDVLINNAGIIAGDEQAPRRFGDLSQDELSTTFLINSIAPLMVVELFAPLLRHSANPVVVNITSSNGSIAQRASRGKYGYCASKAALNMITKILSYELKEDGAIVVALHPGWVQTPMTRNEPAPMEPDESIRGMLRVIDALSPEDCGKFLDWQGRELPW